MVEGITWLKWDIYNAAHKSAGALAERLVIEVNNAAWTGFASSGGKFMPEEYLPQILARLTEVNRE